MPRLNRTPNTLAASLVALVGLQSSGAIANTIVVTSCLDSGQGTQRAAVADPSVDTNDLSQLPCNPRRITLGSEIAVTHTFLRVYGAGAGTKLIDGSGVAPPRRVLHFSPPPISSSVWLISNLSKANDRVFGDRR